MVIGINRTELGNIYIMNVDGEGGGNGVRVMLILKLNHLYKLKKSKPK